MGPHGKSTAAARSLLLREARSLYQDALQDAEERRSLPWRVVLHLAVTVGLAGLRVADVFVSDTGDGRIESKYPPAAALAEAVALLCVGVASFAWSVHRGRQIQFEMSSRIDRAIAQYEESVSPRRGRHGRGPGRGARPGQRRRPRPRFDGHWQHSVRSLLDERLLVPVTSVSVVPTYRDGVWRSIPGNLLVQHDVIALMEGDIAPADAQCLDSDDSDDSVRRGQEVRVREAPAPGAGAAHSAANPGADARDVSTLRLARRMRRFLVLATPLRAHLRHLLDPRQRPRPLMQDHRRRAERVAAMVAAAAALVAVTAVVVRAAARGDMSWGGALLTRLATILLLATGPWYPALYALCEAIGTALLLAKVEAATHDPLAGRCDESLGFGGGDVPASPAADGTGAAGSDSPPRRGVSDSALSGDGLAGDAEDEEAGEMGRTAGTVAPPASLRRILYYTMRTIRGSADRPRRPTRWDAGSWLRGAWEAAEAVVAGSASPPPLPPVLREFRLLERLGGVTVTCAVDSEVVLEREPVVEEVFLLDRKKSGLTLDLYRTSTAPFGVNFETRDWRRLLPLLKPLGLSCLAHSHAGFSAPFMDEDASPSPPPQRLRDSLTAEASEGEGTARIGGPPHPSTEAGHRGAPGAESAAREEEQQHEQQHGERRPSGRGGSASDGAAARAIRALAHYVRRQPPASSAVYALARTMGFVDVDLSGFKLCRRLHVTAPRLIQPFVSSRRVTPPPPRMVTHLTGLVVEDTRTQSLQLMSRGHPGLVLERCSAYWDGRTVRPLTDVSRRLVADMYSQLRQENFTCEAFAYRPIADAERHLFPAQGETFHRPNAYLVEDSLEVEEAEEQQQEQQRAAAAALLAAHKAEEGQPRGDEAGQADESADASVQRSSGAGGNSRSSVPSEGDEEGGARASQARTALQIDGGPSALAGQQSLLDPVQRNQVFVGMTATREQPNGSIQRLVDTLTTAGVRFAYFSPCTYRLTKPLANSMGLETGWNCAISLREWEDEIAKMLEGWDLKARLPHGIDSIRQHLEEVDNVPLLVSLYTDATPNTCRETISIMQENGESVAAVGSSLFAPNGDVMAQSDLAIAVSSLGDAMELGHSTEEDEVEEEEEEEEGGGVGAARLRGSHDDEGRGGVEPSHVDLLPSHIAAQGASEASDADADLDTDADAGTGRAETAPPPPRLRRTASDGAAPPAAAPTPLHVDDDNDPALRPAVSVGPTSAASVAGSDDSASGSLRHALSSPPPPVSGISSPSPRRAVRGARGHVSAADLRFSERLTTLPCALTLPRAASLLPLTAVLREGRRALANFRQALLFAVYAHGVLLAAETVAAALTLPALFTPGAVLWLSWVAVPALCAGISIQPAEEAAMSSRRVPLKLLPHSAPPAVARHMGYLAARAAPAVAALLLVHAWVLSSAGVAVQAMVWGEPHAAQWAAGRGLPAVADAQAASLLCAGFVLCAASAGFLQRNQSLRDEPPRNALWIAATAATLCAHLLEAGLLRALRGNESLFGAALSPWLWPVMVVLVPGCILAVDEAVKRHDRRLFTREMHGLRLIFDTRLGMHSPQ